MTVYDFDTARKLPETMDYDSNLEPRFTIIPIIGEHQMNQQDPNRSADTGRLGCTYDATMLPDVPDWSDVIPCAVCGCSGNGACGDAEKLAYTMNNERGCGLDQTFLTCPCCERNHDQP